MFISFLSKTCTCLCEWMLCPSFFLLFLCHLQLWQRTTNDPYLMLSGLGEGFTGRHNMAWIWMDMIGVTISVKYIMLLISLNFNGNRIFQWTWYMIWYMICITFWTKKHQSRSFISPVSFAYTSLSITFVHLCSHAMSQSSFTLGLESLACCPGCDSNYSNTC